MNAADILERLSVPWRHGAHVDLTGIVCADRLDLSGRDLPGVDFSGARFPQGIDAQGARFQGLAWFRGVVFGGPSLFQRATFVSDARFEETQFDYLADFSEAEFRGIARFDAARFARGASWCDHTRFAANTDFTGIQIHGRLWLRGAQVQGARLNADRFPLSYGYAYT